MIWIVLLYVLADALAKILPDSNFAQELAQENMTWVEQIIDMLKKFIADIKAALRGSDLKESAPHVDIRENIGGSLQYLEEIRQMYDKLAAGAVENYQAAMEATAEKTDAQAQKNTTREGSVSNKARMTDAEIQAVQNIGRISVNQFSAADVKATERFAQQYWKEMGVKSPFFRAWFGDWRANDQTKVQVATQKGDARGVQQNVDTGWDIQLSGKVFNETGHKAKKNQGALAYLPYINDVVKKAVLLDSFGVGQGKTKSDNSLLMHSMYAVADIGNGPVLLKLFVEEMNNPNADGTTKRAYQLQNIEMQQLSAKGSSVSSSPVTSTATIRTVADLFAAVKQKDADFNPNPVSGITNADGTPMVVYHGTNAEFNVFDKRRAKVGVFGKGFYFAPSKGRASAYGSLKVLETYLAVRTPFVVQDSMGFTAEDYRSMQKQFGIQDKITDQNVAKILQQQGYDGIIAEDGSGNIREVVAFEPTQIKSATDNIGTFDGSNPDIRYKRRASAIKTFRNSQNAKGEFVANVLIDLNNPDSEWWTGRYNRGILSMSMSDDTEFEQFYAEIEKRTKDMEEYDGATQPAVTDAFTVQDGNGKEYVYRVELDGYMHGVVLEKVDKKKFEAALRKETVGGNYGESDANIKGRAGNARVGMGRSRASNGRRVSPDGTVRSGRVGSRSSESNQAGNDSRGQSADQEISDSVTDTKVSGKKRGTTLSDREVLEVAALRMDTSTLTEGEKAALDIFKDRLAELRKLQIERERLGSLWHEQQFGSGDRSEAPKTLNRMQVLDGQIERAVNSVLSVEDKQVLRDVLQKARQYVKEQSVDHYRGILERRKDRSTQAQLRQKLHSTVHELSQLLLHGDKNHHVPESMRKAVAGALDVINAMDARKTAAQIAALDTRIMELLQQKQTITQGMPDC